MIYNMIQADKPLVWLHGEIRTPPFSRKARIESGLDVMKRMLNEKSLKMKDKKKKQLEAKGWKVGSVEQFLDLSKEEVAYIELKLLLSESLAGRRKRKRLNQVELAKLLKSSQSRVAKMEKGDPTVSLDLLIRSLLAMGTTKRELAKIISSSDLPPASGPCGILPGPTTGVIGDMPVAR